LTRTLPRILAIVNVTPDSFSDGGRYLAAEAAIAHGRACFAAGAHAVDVGGESTRPGAAPVDPDEELRRVLPVVRALAGEGTVSIDTRRASVARVALEAGARMVNDVSGGRDPDMLPLVADAACDLVLMHMRGVPATMQEHATYDDAVREVWEELARDVSRAVRAGVRPERIVWDPGIGFAKHLEHNLALLRALPRFTSDRQVLVGASRKRFIGALTGQDRAEERLEGSLAAALHAAESGAAWVRVHDVAATARAFAVWKEVRP
jgi:dihydropteroate synthase